MISFLLFIALTVSVSDKPYNPDIKVGIIKKAPNCRKIINDDSLVYANIEAQIEGQPIPVISTNKTGKPIYFKLSSSKVIPGFKKGLMGACKGEIRRITIPPALAYEKKSIDGLFPPYSTWIVKAEIVEIVDSSQY